MEKFIEYLKSFQPGEIQISEQLERALWDCWHEFQGMDQEKMEGQKLLRRMERAYWKPPVFSFVIERHGATCGGSMWADLQKWELNLGSKEASCKNIRRRQVYKMEPKLDVALMAKEVADLILKHKADERLRWNKDGAVRIQIGKIIPATKAQTTTGRRKRFRKALLGIIAEVGWEQIKANVYARPKGSEQDPIQGLREVK